MDSDLARPGVCAAVKSAQTSLQIIMQKVREPVVGTMVVKIVIFLMNVHNGCSI